MTKREELAEKFDQYCDEYAAYLMDHVTDEAVICNGDTLLLAQEDGILYDEFLNSLMETV